MKKTDWIHDMRAKAEGQRSTPPEGLWDAIEEGLGHEAAAPVPSSKKLFLHGWRRWVSAAAAVAVFLGAALYWVSPQNDAAAPDSQMIAKTEAPKPEAPSNALLMEPEDEFAPSAAEGQPMAMVPMKMQKTPRAGRTLMPCDPEEKATAAEGHLEADSAVAECEVKEPRAIYAKAKSTEEKQEPALSEEASAVTADSQSNISLSLIGGTMLGRTETSAIGTAKHRMPASLGIRVGFPVTENLRLSAGVTYSWLKSEIESSGLVTAGSSYHQTCHYLGIPLAAEYVFWSHGRWAVYGIAGAMAQKMVGGTPDDKPWQWSVNAAPGIRVLLSRDWSLFFEPGVAYYPDNHSGVSNIYSSRPWNLDLKLGLSLSMGK